MFNPKELARDEAAMLQAAQAARRRELLDAVTPPRVVPIPRTVLRRLLRVYEDVEGVADACRVRRHHIDACLARGAKTCPRKVAAAIRAAGDATYRSHRRVIPEDVEHFLAFGYSPRGLAHRLGVADPDTLAEAMRTAGRPDLAARCITTAGAA